RYGGPNVGWSFSDSCMEEFCTNCTWGPSAKSFHGYQDQKGWATPPTSLGFSQTCPQDVRLNSDPFEVSLVLEDGFGTAVVGNLVSDSPIWVSMGVENVENCQVESKSGYLTARVGDTG